jgi:hypothetical protein
MSSSRRLQRVEELDWRSDNISLFSTATSIDGRTVYLTVERKPDGDHWDWLVWREGDGSEMVRFGDAPSDLVAIRHAEEAAGEWGAGA